MTRHPIETLWRECGLPEYFLGTDGSNHKLYDLYERVRIGSPTQGEVEAAAEKLWPYLHAGISIERTREIARVVVLAARLGTYGRVCPSCNGVGAHLDFDAIPCSTCHTTGRIEQVSKGTSEELSRTEHDQL